MFDSILLLSENMKHFPTGSFEIKTSNRMRFTAFFSGMKKQHMFLHGNCEMQMCEQSYLYRQLKPYIPAPLTFYCAVIISPLSLQPCLQELKAEKTFPVLPLEECSAGQFSAGHTNQEQIGWTKHLSITFLQSRVLAQCCKHGREILSFLKH